MHLFLQRFGDGGGVSLGKDIDQKGRFLEFPGSSRDSQDVIPSELQRGPFLKNIFFSFVWPRGATAL